MTDVTINKNEFYISTDKTKLDIDAIHEFLSTKAYWCLNIPKQGGDCYSKFTLLWSLP